MKEKRKTNTDTLKTLDTMTDDQIDYSDSPEVSEKFWKNAKLILPKNKTSLTIRLDNEVLDWFRSQGRGYQTKINAVLKSYVLANK
jgi:uncharacterized protein (DUF4415 family)